MPGADPEPLSLEAPGPYTIGRGSDADWKIPDQAVSRSHARIDLVDDQWMVADLGSRHGTFLNGRQLGEGDHLPVRPGDQLAFGNWTCRCTSARHRSEGMPTRIEAPDIHTRVSAIRSDSLAGIAQRRLDALLEACRTLNAVGDRAHIADAIARTAAAGADCRRALVVRQVDQEAFEVIAATDDATDATLSQSLLAAAMRGELVELSKPSDDVADGKSIVDLNIRTAICAPIVVGDAVDALLYLDTRGTERGLASDAAAFCQSLAQLGGLALERLLRAEVESHRDAMERDLAAARRAQELLMPARTGKAAGVRYAFESLAGRFVAGDLFEFLPLDDNRTALFLGDVSGKGVGAAVLMSAVQSQLRTLLLDDADLPRAMGGVNRFLLHRAGRGKFITLVACVVDRDAATIEIVDAGHGFACLAPPGASPIVVDAHRGIPLGVDPDVRYESATIDLEPGTRFVMFSDGVVEQTNPRGAQFGLPAALDLIGAAADPDADVATLLEAVRNHAQGPLADDLTVASAIFEPDA